MKFKQSRNGIVTKSQSKLQRSLNEVAMLDADWMIQIEGFFCRWNPEWFTWSLISGISKGENDGAPGECNSSALATLKFWPAVRNPNFGLDTILETF